MLSREAGMERKGERWGRMEALTKKRGGRRVSLMAQKMCVKQRSPLRYL